MLPHHFFSLVNEISINTIKNEDKAKSLLVCRDSFITELKNLANKRVSLNSDSDLSKLTDLTIAEINTSIEYWLEQWEDSSSMRELSDRFSNKIILLVFGKVNAGKSSFCNQFSSHFSQEEIKPFYLEGGEIKYFQGGFLEGITETTARLQGVELGSSLVLLDSPGLHSVTDENGDITRKFTDSADAVLLLTPSSSPGQVQELDDLKAALAHKKPLQFIISRSDTIEEDINAKGELIQCLSNKSESRREDQEHDVLQRAKEVTATADHARLQRPISISVHWYKENIAKVNSL